MANVTVVAAKVPPTIVAPDSLGLGPVFATLVLRRAKLKHAHDEYEALSAQIKHIVAAASYGIGVDDLGETEEDKKAVEATLVQVDQPHCMLDEGAWGVEVWLGKGTRSSLDKTALLANGVSMAQIEASTKVTEFAELNFEVRRAPKVTSLIVTTVTEDPTESSTLNVTPKEKRRGRKKKEGEE